MPPRRRPSSPRRSRRSCLPPSGVRTSSPSENVASVVCRGGERLTRSGRHPRASEQGAVRQCRSRPCSKSGSHAHQARGRPGLFWHSSCSVSIRVWGYIPRSDAYPAFASWGSGGPLQREEEGEKRQEGGWCVGWPALIRSKSLGRFCPRKRTMRLLVRLRLLCSFPCSASEMACSALSLARD